MALLQMGQFLCQDNSSSTFRLQLHSATTSQDLVNSRPDLSLKGPSLVSRLQDLRHMSISPSAMDSKHWIEARAELLSREGTADVQPSVTQRGTAGQQQSATSGIYWSVVISADSSPCRTQRVKQRLSEHLLGPLSIARKPALLPRSNSSNASMTGSEKEKMRLQHPLPWNEMGFGVKVDELWRSAGMSALLWVRLHYSTTTCQ